MFNLSHALSGRSQLPQLAQVLPQLPQLRVLLLANDDVDDWGLQVREKNILAHVPVAKEIHISCCIDVMRACGRLPMLQRPIKTQLLAVFVS